MAPIPTPRLPLWLRAYTHLRGIRRPPRCGDCSLPGSRCLFPIGSIHPSLLHVLVQQQNSNVDVRGSRAADLTLACCEPTCVVRLASAAPRGHVLVPCLANPFVNRRAERYVLLPTQPRLRWQRVSEAAPTSKWIRVFY